MLIILDENFNVIETSDAAINQGDAALGRIQVVAPYPNNMALVVSFTLPNGFVTPRYPLINAISATDNTKTVYTLNTPATVFSLKSGTVTVQLFALLPDGASPVNQYHCLLNVYSSQAAVGGKYQITDTFICDSSLTAGVPAIVPTADTAGLTVVLDEEKNAYFLTGTLNNPSAALAVTVTVTYSKPTNIAATATNFTVRKGVPFNLPAYADIKQTTWESIVANIALLGGDISDLKSTLKELDLTTQSYNLWELDSGIYALVAKAPATGKLYYKTDSAIEISGVNVNTGFMILNGHNVGSESNRLKVSSFYIFTDKSIGTAAPQKEIIIGSAMAIGENAYYYELLHELTGDYFSFTVNDWSEINNASALPYRYMATVDASGFYVFAPPYDYMFINDDAVAFATYGFALISVDSSAAVIYAIDKPAAAQTFKIRRRRATFND